MYRLLVTALALSMAAFLWTLFYVSLAHASCCEDFAESSYSIDSHQLADFGLAVVGYHRAHIVPLDFAANVMNISMCESTNRPEAVNPTGCMGLLQICPDRATRRLVQNMGYTWPALLDPDVNLDVAVAWYRLTGRSFKGAWECAQ